MPGNRQQLVNDAKAILARIKGREMQVFDVQTQCVHTEDEIKALRAALRHYIDHCDRDFKVAQVVEAGNLNIEPGDAPENVLQEAATAMDGAESSEIIGGGILFKGTNGKWYTVVTESYIVPADPKFVKDSLPKPFKIGGYDWSTDELLEFRKVDTATEDEASLCEYVSRKFKVELTFNQATKLLKAIEANWQR